MRSRSKDSRYSPSRGEQVNHLNAVYDLATLSKQTGIHHATRSHT